MISTTQRKALNLQKRILKSLKTEVELLLGQSPLAILNYQKEYRQDFPKRLRQNPEIQVDDLIRKMRQSDITLIADFHTFDHSQRTALRLINQAAEAKQFRWFIGLEMISSQYQSILDSFQDGKISVEKFHQEIAYDTQWGFPWKNYAPIFDWARENQVRLIALNRPNLLASALIQKDQDELHSRDQWAAGIITDLFAENHNKEIPSKLIVLYGELHVGSQHLPKQIKEISQQALDRPLTCTTIYQNEESLYWQLAQKYSEKSTGILQVHKQGYCIFSSTPWAKLQSLINWAEGDPSERIESESDYLSSLRTYGNSLAQFFSLPEPNYESLSITTFENTEFLNPLEGSDQLTLLEKKMIRTHIEHNQRFYLPQHGLMYLGIPSHNGLAELASKNLFIKKSSDRSFFQFSLEDYHRLILENTFSFLGSLILNPLRQSELTSDHLKRLEKLKNGATPLFPQEALARAIAGQKQDYKPLLKKKSHGFALMMAARLLGKTLGKKLHSDLIAENIEVTELKETILAGLSGDEKEVFSKLSI